MRIFALERRKTSKLCTRKDLTRRCASGFSLVSLGDPPCAFIDTNHLDAKEPRVGWKGRFFHSQNMTSAYYAVASGAWIHVHSHPNDEAWNVIAGELEIKIAVETRVAGPGCAVVVPPEIGDHMAEKTSPDFSR